MNDQQTYEQALSNWAKGVDTNLTDEQFEVLERRVKPSIGVPGEHKLPIQMWSIGKDNENKLAKEQECIAQFKIDGVALLLHYRSGNFVDAFTRGDGLVGQCVTHHAQHMSFPKRYRPANPGRDMYVVGEAYITKHIAKILGYKNPRNGVAGMLNSKDVSPVNDAYIEFMAFDIPISIVEIDEAKKLKALRNLGFKTPTSFRDIDNAISIATEIRENLPYEIDGIVVKVNNPRIQKDMGYTDHHPRFYSAYKFAAANDVSTVTKIEWQIGRTGMLVPVVHFEPIELGGATIRKATAHSCNNFTKLQIAVGDKVQIKKAGDIIPYIAAVVSKGINTTDRPRKCPGCDFPIISGGAHLFCTNYKCLEQRVQAFEYACKTIGVKGIGYKTAEAIVKRTTTMSLRESFQRARETNSGRFPESVPMWKALQMLGEEGLGKAKAKAEAAGGIDLTWYLTTDDAAFLTKLLNVEYI